MSRKSGKSPSKTMRPVQNPRSRKDFEFDSPLMVQGGRGDSWPQNEEIDSMRQSAPGDPMGFIPGAERRPNGTRNSG